MLLVLFLCVGAVSANENVTDDVMEMDSVSDFEEYGISDDNLLESTVTVSGNTFDDIETAIDNANKNDVIKLSGTYSSKGSSIYIDKSVTLQGSSASNKATLDAKGLSGIILASHDIKITLKNIIFKNFDGDAVSAYGITVSNCNFLNGNGHAINLIESSSSTLSIKNSNFQSNNGDYAPAIYLYLNQGTCTIENCIFKNNKATDWAGAVHVDAGETATVNILKSTFNSNSAGEDSAIRLLNGKGVVKNNIFINNNAGEESLYSVGYISQNYVLENNTIGSNSENLKIEFLNNLTFYGEVCQIRFTDNNNPLSNKKILVEAYNRDRIIDHAKFNVLTDINGIAKFAFASQSSNMNVGTWDLQVMGDSGNTKLLVSNNNLNIKKLSGNVVLNDLTTTYSSGKSYSVKLVNKENNNVAANVGLYVTIYKNGFYLKNYHVITDLNGVANIKISDLGAASYKVFVTSDEPSDIMSLNEKQAKVKINKAPTKVKAPKITSKFKKSKKFKVTVKAYNKPVKNIKVKVKVFTGKKSKTYTIKTDKNGVAKLDAKKLKRGAHKVIISSGNNNYKISAKSKIIIR